MNNVLPLRWRRSTYCGPDQINCVELAAVPNPGHAGWRKSTLGGGDHGGCVELAVLANADGKAWRKSSHSGGDHGDCVELAAVRNVLAVRDSKDPDGPVLLLDRHAAAGLLTSVKTGEHDL
ncbi:DUF397 domain-containing protein [Thermomonospora amylolytica]|uniref:DUF397 domain-containing protein n=1 Tax=Thermomonospora amylolytica TaxID=1411117 RepID=UPI000E6BE746|nr:DUF397 domain-containing protein [Thermomonospora amylolytica]